MNKSLIETNSISEENIKLIKKTIKSCIKEVENNPNSSLAFSKKLTQFIESLKRQIAKENNLIEFSLLTKSIRYQKILEILFSMGADYLKHDSLLKIEYILNSHVLKNCLSPESAIMIFMKETYDTSNKVIIDNSFNLTKL